MTTLKFGKTKNFFRKNEALTSNQIFICFECGKQCYMKSKCPNISKKNGHKGKKEFKSKNAYIA